MSNNENLDMENVFFSKKNFKMLYNVVCQKIENDTQVDIRKQKKGEYPRQLHRIMKNLYRDKHTLNIPQNIPKRDHLQALNKHVLSFFIPYAANTVNMIKKGGALPRDTRFNDRIRPINTMDFPKMIRKNTEQVNADFEKLQQKRQSSEPNRPSFEQFQQRQQQREQVLQQVFDNRQQVEQRTEPFNLVKEVMFACFGLAAGVMLAQLKRKRD